MDTRGGRKGAAAQDDAKRMNRNDISRLKREIAFFLSRLHSGIHIAKKNASQKESSKEGTTMDLCMRSLPPQFFQKMRPGA